MVGSIIQATVMEEFKVGPKIRNRSKAGNSLQRVRGIPKINATNGSRVRVDKVVLRAEKIATCKILPF